MPDQKADDILGGSAADAVREAVRLAYQLGVAEGRRAAAEQEQFDAQGIALLGADDELDRVLAWMQKFRTGDYGMVVLSDEDIEGLIEREHRGAHFTVIESGPPTEPPGRIEYVASAPGRLAPTARPMKRPHDDDPPF